MNRAREGVVRTGGVEFEVLLEVGMAKVTLLMSVWFM
jgi:hypothetical protein